MPMPIWLYLVTICVVVREIYCNACLWFRGAHLSVVSRGAILYYLPVCGFAGLTCLWFRGVLFSLTCLWFRGVLFLLFACLWFRGAHLSVVSRGANHTICLSVGSRGLSDCGFAGHFVLSFFVIEFLP